MNVSQRVYQHTYHKELINLNPGERKEIPDEVADIWLKSKEIELVADKSDLEAKDREIAELKAKLTDKEILQQLREKAEDLGIRGTRFMGIDRLRKAIAERE